jgi:hypothetical protein
MVAEGEMANFRCERALVMLDEPVPGLNHLRAVDPEGFADLLNEAMSFWMVEAGNAPLTDFLYAPGDRPKWRPAGKGLRSVRGAMELYRKWLEAGENPLGRTQQSLERDLAVLGQVAEVLDLADGRDRRFYFAARDLA